MAMSGLIGEQEDTARLKLLLSDRVQQGSFCLTFDYRVVGRNVGTLRVLLDNNVYPVWEQSHSRHQSWQTELLTVAWKAEAPEAVSLVFKDRWFQPMHLMLLFYIVDMKLQPKPNLPIFQIVFETQRGKEVGGEIGLDNVVLTSGSCQEHGDPIY